MRAAPMRARIPSERTRLKQEAGSEDFEGLRKLPREALFTGIKNRIFQGLARWVPGPFTLRSRLHRWRGVKIGSQVHIACDVVIETAYPQWVSIGSNVQIGMRTLI